MIWAYLAYAENSLEEVEEKALVKGGEKDLSGWSWRGIAEEGPVDEKSDFFDSSWKIYGFLS